MPERETRPAPLPELETAWRAAAGEHFEAVRARALGNRGYRGTLALFRKEMHRFLSIGWQTIVSPVITTMLWYLVFGYSLGDRLDELRGIPYTDFLVPGLVMMAVITNAFLNSAFAFFIGKVHGTTVDLMISPLKPWQLTVAFTGASVVRAMLVGIIIWMVAAFMGAGTFHNVGWTLAFMFLTSFGFALFGLIAGILAKDFDHINFVPSFLLLPLTFLGGVFYSIQILPAPWDRVSLFNPIVYMVNGLRYGMTGVSDVAVLPGFVIVSLSVVAGWMVTLWLLATGRGLKP